MDSNSDEKLTIRDVADAVGASINRVKSLRQRGFTPFWDAGTDDPEDRSWRRYTVLDAVLLACVIELIDGGLAAEVAASAVANGRAYVYDAKHPARSSVADVWIGLLRLDDGAAHVGGPLPNLFADIEDRIKRDIKHFDGGGSGLVLVNASKHYRRVRANLEGVRHDA